MFTRLINQFLAAIKKRSLFQHHGIKTFILFFVIGIGSTLAIASCTPSNSANAPAQQPQVPKLTVLKMGHQKGMALLNIIKAQGSLEKRLQPQGISVTWNEFSSTAPLLDGMGVGAIVFGGGGSTGSVFAQAGDKPIKTLSDLKDKKVAFAKGSGQHYIIVRALEKVGLKYSDIKPLYLTPAEALPAFERGDIDAWLIWDPYTAEAERKLRTRLLADNSTVFGDKAPLESPSFYYAAPDFVRDHPDIVKTILQELEKAGNWSRDNYHDSAKLLSKLYKIDLKTMETVEERGGQRQVLPVTDEVLSGLQRMADTF